GNAPVRGEDRRDSRAVSPSPAGAARRAGRRSGGPTGPIERRGGREQESGRRMNSSSAELTTPPGSEIEPAPVVLDDPRTGGAPRPAARLRRALAQAVRATFGPLSPGLRAGAGAGRPLRQRAGRGADHPVRPGVPGGRALDHRRAVGPAHDAPPGPAREPPA